MKKQYYIEQGKGFRVDIVLYHDGIEVDRIKTWEGSSYEHIVKLHKQGYTEGFLPEDVEEAYNTYLEKLQNII